MDNSQRLSAMFFAARLEKGLTQEQVGHCVGMGGNGYGKIERGINKVPSDLIAPICRTLGISLIDAVHAMAAGFSDDDLQSFVLFSDMGCSVGFSGEEWKMHLKLCEFAGVCDVYSEEAYRLSKAAIDTRRRNIIISETEE